MSKLMERFSNRSLPASSELRERVLDAVEQAIDRVEEVANDAPSVDDVVRGVRRRRIVRSAGTTFVAFAPTVVRAARSRYAGRGSKRFARHAPVVVRTHPVIFGVGIATTAVVSAIGVRRALMQRAREREIEAPMEDLGVAHDAYVEDVDPKHFDLAEEVMRMEDEGGDPSAGTTAGTGQRRFVRQDNGQRVPSS